MNHLPGVGIIWRLFVPLIFAAATQSITIEGLPTALDQNAETQANVRLACPGCSTDSYLRGVFYPSGTSYFGYTQSNDGTWTNAPGGNCTQYYKVLISDIGTEGTWSGALRVKVDTDSSYYKGPGEYLFKVGRYTPSCTSPSVWSNEVTIAITGPTQTPTPTPTTTLAPTSTPNPTATHTPQPTATQTPTIVPSPSPVFEGMVSSAASGGPDILGEQTESTTGTEEQATISGTGGGPTPFIISFLCVGVGFALLATATAWKQTDLWKKQHINN